MAPLSGTKGDTVNFLPEVRHENIALAAQIASKKFL